MELLSKEMLADLAINILNIVILFLVTRALVYKPVKKFLAARREKLDAETARAQELLAEAQEKQDRYTSLLNEADAEKAKLLSEAEAEARARANEIVAQAEAEAGNTVTAARETAEAEKKRAVKEAKDEIASLAVALSGKIMGRTASDEDARRIAEDFFEGRAV